MEAKLKDQKYAALVWRGIESTGHGNSYFAPCEIDSSPHMLLPTLEPPIAHLERMTLISIEPLYKI